MDPRSEPGMTICAGMIVRGNDEMAVSIRNFNRPNVYVRKNWGDPWTVAPLLDAVGATTPAGPGMGSARFLWRYGYRNIEGDVTYVVAPPFAYLGWYVQIRAVIDTVDTELWTGIFALDSLVVDGALNIGGSAVGTGGQIYQALDMSYLLDRAVLRETLANQNGREVRIDHVPWMNKSGDRGLSVIGNRATSANDDGIFRFSADGAVWSHRQFLAMVLSDNRPDDIQFTLTGQDSLLDFVATAGRVEGLTLLSLLDGMIDRRRGFGWKIAKVGGGRGPVVGIEVFTVFDQEITVGDVTLSPNDNIIELELGNVHENEMIRLDLVETNRVDQVRVRGDRITSCFTINKDVFEKGWTDTQEGYYKDGAKNEDGYEELDDDEKEIENDRYRAQERFRQVYRQWRMPADWNWDVGGEIGNPAADEDGGLVENQEADYFNYGRKFLRKLPLIRGFDYTGETPVDLLPDGTEDEYSSPMVWVKHNDKYHPVSRLSEIVIDDDSNKAASCGVKMLDRMMGFELSASPGHEFALNHFSGAEPSGAPVVFDWNEIIATVAVKTDQRVEVVVSGEPPIGGAGNRVKVIDLPYAQLWYIVPQTVVGIDAKGEVEEYGGTDNILRNDKDLMEAVAAAVLGWYGQRRQTLDLTVRYLTDDAKVGDLIRSVGTLPDVYDEVNTVVSAVVWDFIGGTTSVVTNWAQLDFAAIPIGHSPDMGDSDVTKGGEGSGAGSVKDEIEKMKEDMADLPVEPAASGGGIGSGRMRVAEVDSNATGGGYYNCSLQKFDADHWETNNDPWGDDGSTAIVALNIPEGGKTDSHQLTAGKKLAVWRQRDDGDPGKMRWVGVEINFIARCVWK